MSQAEALAFKNASSLVLEETDGSQFLFCDSDLSDYTINQRHGLGMEDILLLEEAGLISALRASNEIEVGESADGFFNARYERAILVFGHNCYVFVRNCNS